MIDMNSIHYIVILKNCERHEFKSLCKAYKYAEKHPGSMLIPKYEDVEFFM